MVRFNLRRKIHCVLWSPVYHACCIIADPGTAVAAGFDFGRERKTPGCDDGTVLPGQSDGPKLNVSASDGNPGGKVVVLWKILLTATDL